MPIVKQKNIVIVNGPNLNLLGKRRPEIYGNQKLSDLENLIIDKYGSSNVNVIFYQTNHEGEIIDKIQECDSSQFCSDKDTIVGIVLNPGAYGHSSYAIRDAIEAIDTPVIEVHISDINKRENFRKNLVLKDVCRDTIVGKGFDGYLEAIDLLLKDN